MNAKPIQNSALEMMLTSALTSRDQRCIRRRLPDPETSPSNSSLIDFNSNDYLSLSQSSILRDHFLKKLSEAPDVLGSGGSRLLVNGRAHAALEARLRKFFNAESALLFNSGFDANVGFFSCIPQIGDVVVCDQYIHASVHDGVRASRARDAQFSFSHNSLKDLRKVLIDLNQERGGLRSGQNSLFLAVESLYSMDGTFAPLREIADLLDEIFPLRNAYLVVDEAHSTFFHRIVVDASLAVILTSTLIRDYLLNYARSLIYTTSLSHANIIAADSSFDMLTNGTAQFVSKIFQTSIE